MKCPGQDTRYWRPGAIFEVKCPDCGRSVEFFKDESTRKCRRCGHRVVNPEMDFGCASYCRYAEECLGELPPELLAEQEELLKDRVAVEMKRHFARDFKRIRHAMRVAGYAEEIVKAEEGDPATVLSAAYLHDIGIKEAEVKYQSTAPEYQYREGPPLARDILKRLGGKEELVQEVCDIIEHHHHPRSEETVNFKALYDADMIANLEEKQEEKLLPAKKLDSLLKNSFLTNTGRKVARRVLSGSTTE